MPTHIRPVPTVQGARVEIQSSIPVELVAAVITIARHNDDRQWLQDLATAVGRDKLLDIAEFCRPLRAGMDLVEFVSDAPDHGDIESFFEFVEGLTDHETAFYLLGRMYPRESLPQILSEESVRRLLEETDTADSAYHEGAGFAWANDIAATRSQIVEVFRLVWNGYLRDHLPELQERWRDTIGELNLRLDRNGPEALWQMVSDRDDLPMEIPAGQPYERILFVPSCLTGYAHGYMFGYGTVIVTISCDRSLDDFEKRRLESDQLLNLLKALSDKNRLRLLRFVSKGECAINGKQMAELLKLSPSVVSRHLAQLRAAGLIEEHSTDNRNITYSLVRAPLEGLSGSLISYLSRSPHD